MSKVKFNVPSFMDGGLPSDGATVISDITLIGRDKTTVIIKKNMNTIYTDKTRSFESNVEKDKFPFQFIFPQNTLINSDSTQFTTPSKSVYIFSSSPEVIVGDKITKNMSDGTVTITPPTSEDSKTLGEKSMEKASSVGKQVDTLIDNSVLLQSSVTSDMSKIFLARDSPFFSIGLIVYKLAMDMIVVFIFWILFVSISCWLKIPSEYLYPTDVTKFPFVYYKAKKPDGKEDPYYNFLKTDDSHVCKAYTQDDVDKARSKQADFFKVIEGLSEEKKAILKVIYPAFANMDESSIPKFAAMLQEKCEKTELCTIDYITYFVGILVFHNYLYCGSVLSGIHTGFSFLSEKVIGNLDKKIMVVSFAALLYYLFISVGEMNKKVMKMFRIKMPKGHDIKTQMVKQFLNLLVCILSAIMCVVTPLCGILVLTCLLSTAYILCKSCLFPYNATILLISFFTFFFSISQYIFIIKNLTKKMKPLELLENMFVKKLSIRTFGSFLGITVPILFGVTYGAIIGSKLFFSFFQLIKRPEVSEMLKNTAASVVLVGLMLLLFHVKGVLGNTYLFMTIIIIILMGFYISTKTS